MKKDEYIVECNKIANEFNPLAIELKNINGDNRSQMYVIASYDKSRYTREDLVCELETRQRRLDQIKEDIITATNNKNFLATETGKNYADSLNKKHEEIRQSYFELQKQVIKEVDDMLKKIGLDDWKYNERACSYPNIEYDTRFELTNSHCDYLSLDLEYKYRTNSWFVSCNTSFPSYTEEISEQGKMFRQFKAYSTICEHSLAIHYWVENVYQNILNKKKDLSDKMHKICNGINSPYYYYIQESMDKNDYDTIKSIRKVVEGVEL